MDNNEKIFIGVAILVTVMLLFAPGKGTTTTELPGQYSWDINSEVKSAGYEIYLVEEPDFDYTNPIVSSAAQLIKSSSSSADEAVKNTAKYVYNNIKYTIIDVNYCFNEKASTALQAGIGDCVSMSRAVTALLRAQGIPARTMGGCLTSKRCSPVFAVVPGVEAQVTPMTPGDFKKRGFLHEYVEFWTPSRGWMMIEATAGLIFPMSCDGYLDYGYDSNNYNRCVITDASFWNECNKA